MELSVPAELAREAEGLCCATAEERMRVVLRWALENVDRGGGPFAAGVFEQATGLCVSAGVNQVLALSCSVAHAEIMALMLAEKALGTPTLAARGEYVLVSSAQPCAQCYGAIPWAGVSALEYGAAREDVEAIGFEEGPFPLDWRGELERRGIRVRGPLLREAATEVLGVYVRRGGELYNGFPPRP